MSHPEYWEHIKSHAFRKVRQLALRRDQGCRLCGEKEGELETHHRTYARFGSERPKDVTTLCVTCHRSFHKVIAPLVGFSGYRGRDEDKAAERLAALRPVLPAVLGREGRRGVPLESTPVDEGGVE